MADTQLTGTDCIILLHFVLILFWYRIHNSFALPERERDRERWTQQKREENLAFSSMADSVAIAQLWYWMCWSQWFVDMYAFHSVPFNLHPQLKWHVSKHLAYFAMSSLFIFAFPIYSYKFKRLCRVQINEEIEAGPAIDGIEYLTSTRRNRWKEGLPIDHIITKF